MTQESTTKVEHSPLPWEVRLMRIMGTPKIHDASGNLIFTIFRQPDEAPAIAEFIVRACNSHDSLLAALEKAHLFINDYDGFVEKYGGPEFPESSHSVEGWLVRELIEPAALAIKEAGG